VIEDEDNDTIWGFQGGDYEEWRLLTEPHGVTSHKTPFFEDNDDDMEHSVEGLASET
jgi:hypothetical protein